MAHVFVTRRLPGDALDRLAADHTVAIWPDRLPPGHDELIAHAAGADGLLCTVSDRIDADTLDALPRLRALATYAVGTDNLDLSALVARGVAVGNTPDVLTDATADLTWALLMAAARQVVPAAASAREDWRTWEPTRFLGADVAGARLLIIGAGRIGRAVARRATGFDMDVELIGRDHAGLDTALARADFVSLHCPLTPETRGLFDAERLARLRPGAILVNTARGPVVDSLALAEALRAGRLGAAALDVTDPEPLPSDHPLWRAPNVLICPHIGSATRTARARMTQMAVDNLLAGLAGRPMPHPVA